MSNQNENIMPDWLSFYFMKNALILHYQQKYPDNKIIVEDICEMVGKLLGAHDAYYKLKEYEDLDEQGLLLKLPCKLGTTLYYVVPDSLMSWPDTPIYKIITIAFSPDMINEFGKWLFLTRAEAEIACKEANS